MNFNIEDGTDFLIPKRSFFTGLTTINLVGNTAKFNTSKSQEEADSKAIHSDWKMIGIDIKRKYVEDIKKWS